MKKELLYESENLTCSRLDGGIYAFHFANNRHDTLREFVDYYRQLLVEYDTNKTFMVILDATDSGFPAIQAAFQYARYVYRGLDALPEIRVAYMYQDHVLFSIFERMLNLIGVGNRRLIEGADYEFAVAWLLEGDSP